MKAKLLKFGLLAVCGLAPWQASALPTLTWDESGSAVATGFTFPTGGKAYGSGESAGLINGTFFSTVDVAPFGGANVWLVEPGSKTLSDWVGIDSLERVAAAGGGWTYTLNVRYASDGEDEGQGNVPDAPVTPPWDPYPFTTETGNMQDITGDFRLRVFPGYTSIPGLSSLVSIQIRSDVEGTPDSGNTLVLMGLALGALALLSERFGLRSRLT